MEKQQNKKRNWYFDMSSAEYGSEEFGDYRSRRDALAGIKRVKEEALRLKDGIERTFSEPYQR